MAIKVGSVVIDLEARTASFMRGMGRAVRGVRGLAAEIGKLQTLLIGGAGVAGLTLAARSANQFATEMAQVSARLGVSTEFLSQMRVSIEAAGISFEGLTSALQDMQERLEDAVRGGGEAREALDELGLSAADLLAQGGEQAFKTLVDALREVDTESRQIFLADKLFADAGQRLVGVINETSESLERQAARTRELGLVISQEAAEAAQDLTRRMAELLRVGQGFTQQATQAMTPALNQIAQAFLNLGSAANFGTQAGRVFGDTLLALTETGAKVAGFFNMTGRLIGAFAASLQRTDVTPRQLFEDVVKGAEDGNRAINQFIQTLRDIPQAPDLVFDVADQEQRLRLGAQFNEQLLRTREATDQLSDAKKEESRINKELEEDLRRARALREEMNDRIAQHTRNRQESMDRAKQAAEEHARIVQKTLDDVERQQRATQRTLFRTVDRGLQTMLDTSKSVKERFRDLVNDITAQLARLAAQEAFGQLFGGIGGAAGGRGFSNLLGTVLGFLPGFQRGADFRVGGSGGADSQLVAFRASPNERVQVTPAGSPEMGHGGAVTVIQNLYFQGAPDPLSAQQVGAAAAMALQQSMARNG